MYLLELFHLHSTLLVVCYLQASASLCRQFIYRYKVQLLNSSNDHQEYLQLGLEKHQTWHSFLNLNKYKFKSQPQLYILRIMRSSKMLNMSTSKLSAKLVDQSCIQHDNEPFVNFCAAMTCVKPLCAECIENHYAYHKNLRTPPEIISFKSLKNQCVTKIGEILDHVGADDNDVNMNELGDIFQTSMKKIRQTRDHCRKIMDSYFHNLQDYVRKRMQKMLSDQSDLFRQLDKVTTIVSQLKMLCNRLQNPRTFIPNAQTIIKLDGDKIEQKVKQGYLTVNNLKQQHRVNLQVEKNYEQKLVNFLSKTVYYGNYENIQTMPKVAQQLITQSHWDNMSRSRQKSREKLGGSSYNNDEGSNRLQKSKTHNNSRMMPQDRSMHDRSLEKHSFQKQDDKKSSSLTRKSSSKSLRGGKKQILGMNTFKQSSQRKFLHFFQNDDNILHYLDLQQSQSFQSIDLNINFKIPDFHKSIATPNGDLYVIGGSLAQNGIKSQKIYKYDFTGNSLQYCASLKYGRSSHSVCFNTKYIYIMGGFLNQQQITNKCERFDIQTNKVEEIRPMNYEACSFACCSFNGRFIFKFGGVGDQNTITHYIEMYDQKTGEWSVVNPSIQLVKGQTLLPLSTSAAIQITSSQIMVMGGYDQNNSGHKQTYILKIDQNLATIIKDINTYPLPFAEGFWNNIPILHKKHVFVLQNISYNNDECSESQRAILIYDGVGWKVVN